MRATAAGDRVENDDQVWFTFFETMRIRACVVAKSLSMPPNRCDFMTFA
jgi:hypothetical protein